MAADRETEEKAGRSGWLRYLPLAVLAAGFAAFLAFGPRPDDLFAALSEHREALTTWRDNHAVLAAAAYIALYIAIAAFSLPAGAVVTISGGFLFGWLLGTLYTVVGATIGATLLFLAARTSLGEAMRRKAGPALKRFEAGFQEDAASYLLVMRLIPAFPFWLVNLAPALLGVGLATFVVTTFVGIIPGTYVFASIGDGVGAILARGETPNLTGLFTEPRVIAPIVGLIVLALLPVIVKRFVRKPDLKEP